MEEVLKYIIFMGLILLGLCAIRIAYKMGKQEGIYQERMLTLNLIAKIQYNDIKDLNVFQAQNLLLDKLRNMY